MAETAAVKSGPGNQAIIDLLEGFDLNPKKVYSFTLHLEAGRPVTCAVQMYAEEKGLKKVAMITKHFELKEVPAKQAMAGPANGPRKVN